MLQPNSFEAMYEPIVEEENPLGFESFYGLGHSIVPLGPIKAIFHSGGHPGTRTFFLTVPKTGDGLCMFFNSDNANPVQEQILMEWSKSLGLIP